MNIKHVPVLMYHRIGHANNEWERKYCVSPDNFRAHINVLASKGHKACDISEFISWLRGSSLLPEKSLLITFDDGFSSVFKYGLPVLKEMKWPAAMFLVSGLIGKEDIWCRNENPSGQTYPLMDLDEIEIMRSNGFSFHSHSRSHADLSLLNEHELENELRGSREDLEQLIGEPILYFAYPYGRYNDLVLKQAAAAGYKAGFSVQPGFNRPDMNPFLIRRIDVFGTDTPAQLLRKINLGTNDGSWRHTLQYYSSRLLYKSGVTYK